VGLKGRETSERKAPKTLEEAYELRDASATPEERGFYQEHVYRLRAKKYRFRGIRIKESVRRRERNRAEALQAENEEGTRFWWGRTAEDLEE
jgi:hypothetical protein